MSSLGAIVRKVLERLGLVAAHRDDTYHAFISYSHAVDGALAPALEHGLQRFAKPWYRPRAVRVFRDEASLSANPGLWSSIEDALDSSRFFILLASPGAASSPWVAREAAHWRARKPIQNLLIALTDGELAWDDAAGDFNWEQTTSLPDTLHGAFAEEPRFVDLRWARTSDHLSLNHPQFRDAVADLAAPLHGVPKDVLASEEVRQHRKTVRIARLAALALTGLTLASIAFGAFAYVQRNQAREQRDIATARALSASAEARLGSRVDHAALLSLEAYRVRPSPETRSGLVRAIQRTQHMIGFLHAGRTVVRIAFTPQLDRLVAAGLENVTVWKVDDDRQPDAVLPIRAAKAIAISPDGSRVAAGGPLGTSIWALDPRPARVGRIPGVRAEALRFLGTQGARLAAVGEETLGVYDAGTGARLWQRELGAGVSVAAFAPDRSHVAIGTADELLLVGLSGPSAPMSRLDAPNGFSSLSVAPGGQHVAGVGLQHDTLTLWDTTKPRAEGTYPLAVDAHAVDFAPDGTLILGLADGRVELRTRDGFVREQVFRGPAERVFDVAAPSGDLLAGAGEQGSIVLWKRADQHSMRFPTDGPVADLDYAAASDTLAVAQDLVDQAVVINFENGGDRRVLDTGVAGGVAVSGDGEHVAIAGQGVTLFDSTGARTELAPAQIGEQMTAVSFTSRDLLAWGAPGRIAFWDLQAMRRLEPFQVKGMPTDLDFDEAGQLAAVATENGATLWNIEERRRLARPLRGRRAYAVAIAPSGEVVAAASADQLILLDVVDDRIWTIDLPESSSVELSFNSAGDVLAVAVATLDGSGQLLFVDPATGAPLGERLVATSGLAGLDFRSDGTSLASGSSGDYEVTLWDDVFWSDFEAMEQRLCSVAGRSLTPDEWRVLVPNLGYRETCA